MAQDLYVKIDTIQQFLVQTLRDFTSRQTKQFWTLIEFIGRRFSNLFSSHYWTFFKFFRTVPLFITEKAGSLLNMKIDKKIIFIWDVEIDFLEKNGELHIGALTAFSLTAFTFRRFQSQDSGSHISHTAKTRGNHAKRSFIF